MGCSSCKKSKKGTKGNNSFLGGNLPLKPAEELNFLEKVIVFISKVFGFIVGGIIISILVIPFSLYLLFKIMFLDESIDIVGIMTGIGKLLMPDNDNNDNDYIDVDDVENIDDYELVGVEDITDKK
tara:strand:+ start:57597 stop:57974 length:378 start_codon:yes stop_codon:yes gene_type:complete